MNEHHAMRARALSYGYEPRRVKGDPSCPRKLGGKRHAGPTCWCRSKLNDHGGAWTWHTGEKVVLWEPYEVTPVELVRVEAAAKEDGLWVWVHGMSPHNPGQTVAIEFRTRR